MTTAYLRVILSMEILISYAPYRHQRYSSTNSLKRTAVCMVKERVCFPYEFTLLSNVAATCTTDGKFVSPTNLHCSQTYYYDFNEDISLFPLRIYTALKHASANWRRSSVCFPYEFTLLSNRTNTKSTINTVCFPYEFTLLSNLYSVVTSDILFVSPTNLHCSQTSNRPRIIFCKIPVSLHRSYHSSLY